MALIGIWHLTMAGLIIYIAFRHGDPAASSRKAFNAYKKAADEAIALQRELLK